jgi:hypothetical protein
MEKLINLLPHNTYNLFILSNGQFTKGRDQQTIIGFCF